MVLPDSLWKAQNEHCLADMEWWEIYTDGPLKNLIIKALNHNMDLKTAIACVKQMAEQKRISAYNLLPQVDASITGDREWENHGGDNSKIVSTFEAKALFAWEIDLFGYLRWGRDAALAEYMQSVEAQHALRMTIIAEVAQAYYELVALDSELTIVKQTLDAREEGVRLAKLRFEGGLTSETAYQQAKLEVARTATLVPDLERNIAKKESDIAFLAGDFPTHIEREESLQGYKTATELPVGLSSGLLERRPDIRQAEQALIAANAYVGVALTNMLPRIKLTGQYGFESTEFSELLASPYGFIDGALLTPLFSAAKNKANWKAMEAAYEQAYYTYEKAVLNAFHEVHNSITDFYKIKEMRKLQAQLEESAKSHVDLTQLQYINGVINYLDVLDAQRGYFDAQIGLSNAIRDELISVVLLYKALGGGW